MMTSDPIADMLNRISMALHARHKQVLIPSSKEKVAIARILKEEGFIQNYQVTRDQPQPKLRIVLKYDEERRPVITKLQRVSKPGRRIYVGRQDIPWVLSGLGIAILSTPRGIMTGHQARRLKVGGEVLCYVW
ncbi:MAG: 30S ribosomal protein S8 [Caldilineales bacterium]|nr:30S ribosomal protein S8 [Caldilineales bacterium]